MSFGGNCDTALAGFEFKKCDYSFGHELGGNGSANQERKLGRTNGKVLLDLHDAEFVFAAFSLDGEDVMSTLLVHPNVKLVGLNLSHVRNRGAKVALQ